MKPIFTEQQFINGQTVCGKLIASLQEANIDVGSSLVGLATAAVIAADTMQAPLETVFETMRQLRKAYQAAKAQAALTAPAPEESKLIVTGIEK